MNKRLYRSNRNKVFFGVCSGLADYLGIDPVIIRILWIVIGLSAFGSLFASLIFYFIAAAIIPSGDKSNDFYRNESKNYSDYGFFSGQNGNMFGNSKRNQFILGAVIAIAGVLMLLKQFFKWFDYRFFVPIALILIGIVIIMREKRNYF